MDGIRQEMIRQLQVRRPSACTPTTYPSSPIGQGTSFESFAAACNCSPAPTQITFPHHRAALREFAQHVKILLRLGAWTRTAFSSPNHGGCDIKERKYPVPRSTLEPNDGQQSGEVECGR